MSHSPLNIIVNSFVSQGLVINVVIYTYLQVHSMHIIMHTIPPESKIVKILTKQQIISVGTIPINNMVP